MIKVFGSVLLRVNFITVCLKCRCMPLLMKNKQIRKVVIGPRGEVLKKSCLKGVEWSSGYDDRVVGDLDTMRLKPGVYLVSFFPVGEAKGWDSITRLKVVPYSTVALKRMRGK